MATQKIETGLIADSAVTTAKLADNSVTAAKIAAGSLDDQVKGISSSADAVAITIDSSENVGIGGSTITDVNLLNLQGSGASKNIGIVFNDTNTSKIFSIQNGGSALKFFDYTASEERMRIDSSGSLLVNSTSAGSSRLKVVGDASRYGILSENLSGYGAFNLKSTTVAQTWSIGAVDNSSNSDLFIYGGSSAGTKVTLDSSGNVGITAAASLRFNGTGDSTHAVGYDSTVDGSFIRGQNGIRFITATGGGTERMRITSVGAIETSTTEAKCLQLNSTHTNGPYLSFQESGAAKFYIGKRSAVSGNSGLGYDFYAAGNYGLSFYANAGRAMDIATTGNLLVGNTYDAFNARANIYASGSGTSTITLNLWNGGGSGCIYERYVNSGGSAIGSITQNGASAVSFNTSSDARLKDVTGSARGLEVINALNPVSYNWKADGKADEGLIAQEVLDIVPNAVSGSEEDYYQMDYSKLVVHLVKGMKEQQAQIEALQSEINLLKGE